MTKPNKDAVSRPEPVFAEFVAMIAACMALGALAVDAMLPALPAMGTDFGVTHQNTLQWVISAFIIGTGVGQLIFGSLSDWLGRRPVLLFGVALYTLASIAASQTKVIDAMICLRFFQGVVAAASSVIARSMVRDRYSGAKMAMVTSMAMAVFFLAPILAPSLGQAVLQFAAWPAIFGILAVAGLSVGAWLFFRMPESLPAAARRKPDWMHLGRVAVFIVTEPGSLFYTLAIALLFGSLLSYVALMPQIFNEIFKAPALMARVFAACAATMGAASILNARLVQRVGVKRMSHFAVWMFLSVAAVHSLVVLTHNESLLSFVILQALTMGCFSLSTSNFTAISMERVGHVAGTAASIQGVITTCGAGLIGAIIGQAWTGQLWLLPVAAFICGLMALTLVVVSERLPQRALVVEGARP